jgi:polysaccharide biosynthesis/export protein
MTTSVAVCVFAQSPAAVQDSDYAIGAGDVLNVTIVDYPDLSAKYRVSDAGTIEIPGLKAPILAAGHAASQVSADISKALLAADMLRNPMVHVFVEEYQSRNVTVVGAVTKPSVYALSRNMTVLEVLSLAGGLAPTAGDTVTVIRKEAQGGQGAGSPLNHRYVVELSKLMQGKDVNMMVQPGDVVSVATAPLIYVVGAVNKPGAFPVPNAKGGVTILEAVALAEGVKSIASTSHSFIVRRSEDNLKHEEIPVDLAKAMGPDPGAITLQDSDILYIPDSGAKKSLHVMGQVALQAISGIAIYGIGYRLGTH